MGKSITSHITTNFNLADMLINTFFGQKKKVLVEGVLYDVFDYFVYSICLNINPINYFEQD